jgi:hypothetical protein
MRALAMRALPRSTPAETEIMEATREALEAAAPWAELFHAYGPATDTPDHLFALVAGTAAERREGLAHLSSAILHQGTPWPATAPVAEVLVGLLRAGHLRPVQEEISRFFTEIVEISEQVAAATASRAELEVEANNSALDAWIAATAPLARTDRDAAETAYEALFEDDVLAAALLARAYLGCVRVAPTLRAAIQS